MRVTFRLSAWVLLLAACCGAGAAPISLRVQNQVLHKIDDRIFGQFMERPSWGETGVEGARVPGTRQLQPRVLEMMKEMKLPIIRFPGGTDVDYLDFTDMIDNAPGRAGPRPVSVGYRGDEVTNNFGYDEFLRLCLTLGAQPLLVVNFRDGLLKKRPLAEAAARAAAFVAYCNAPMGSKLPDNLGVWADLRARNGHPQPYGVKLFQIGNETWAFTGAVRQLQPKDPMAWYVECLTAYVRAMSAVDPSIDFIIDGPVSDVPERARAVLGDRNQVHRAASVVPWQIGVVHKGDQELYPDALTPQAIWNAWVAVPDFDSAGLSTLRSGVVARARKLGYRLAITEWNWNGGWSKDLPKPAALTSSFAKGIGAAGFLHAFIRNGDVIDIACQSMLVGHFWSIAAIRVDPTGTAEPYFIAHRRITALYSNHHGGDLLAIETRNVPTYAQPYQMAGIHPAPTVAYIDLLVTASPQSLFIHAINRHFEQPMKLKIDLSAFQSLPGKAVQYVIEGQVQDGRRGSQPWSICRLGSHELPFAPPEMAAELPPRSVSCIEIRRH